MISESVKEKEKEKEKLVEREKQVKQKEKFEKEVEIETICKLLNKENGAQPGLDKFVAISFNKEKNMPNYKNKASVRNLIEKYLQDPTGFRY